MLDTLTGASIVRMDDDLIMGNMEREHHVQLNEEELIGGYFGERIDLMVDVGATLATVLTFSGQRLDGPCVRARRRTA